jgi:site-specific DNA-methyltransferase (adenine-specific)
MSRAAAESCGTTPFNLLPLTNCRRPKAGVAHPTKTHYDLAAWWCRNVVPEGGVLLDPFAGSETILRAGLDVGAAKVIGIEKDRRYVGMMRREFRCDR